MTRALQSKVEGMRAWRRPDCIAPGSLEQLMQLGSHACNARCWPPSREPAAASAIQANYTLKLLRAP